MKKQPYIYIYIKQYFYIMWNVGMIYNLYVYSKIDEWIYVKIKFFENNILL